MTEVNPFDNLIFVTSPKRKIFALVQTPVWEWGKTDSDNDTDEPYYNMEWGGRLFYAESDCPFCGAIGAFRVSAGRAGVGAVAMNDWACLCCGNADDILGHYGVASLTPRNQTDDEWYELPACIVVSVEK